MMISEGRFVWYNSVVVHLPWVSHSFDLTRPEIWLEIIVNIPPGLYFA